MLLTDMTAEEARQKHEQLKQLHSVARSLLLEIRDRRGFLAMGYENFADYGEKEWGYSASYIHRLATAAEIQNSLQLPIGEKDIPETQLRPLAKIPAAARQAIWDEATKKAFDQAKTVTAKSVSEAVINYQIALEQANQQITLFSTELTEKAGEIETVRQNARKSVQQAQMSADNAESNYKELSNRFDHYLQQGIDEKLQQVQQQVQQQAEEQLSADYQAKIDSQNDEISRLRNDLGKLKNQVSTQRPEKTVLSDEAGKLVDDVEKIIGSIEELESQHEKSKKKIQDEIEELESQLWTMQQRKDKQLTTAEKNRLCRLAVDDLTSALPSLMSAFSEFAGKNVDEQPALLLFDIATKNKLSYAASLLSDYAKALHFLATAEIEDFQ